MATNQVVLVVDDDPELRAILELALTGIPGADIHTAASGEEALSLAASGKIHLLLTDFRMMGMTGIELLQKLKEVHAWPEIGAIVMSGEDDDGLAQMAKDAGAMQFWRKPVSATKLRRFVNDLVVRRG